MTSNVKSNSDSLWDLVSKSIQANASWHRNQFKPAGNSFPTQQESVVEVPFTIIFWHLHNDYIKINTLRLRQNGR